MTRFIPLAIAAVLVAPPLAAQDEGSLFDQGADLILRGLIEEVAPPLQELAGIGAEVLPTFQLLAEEMGPGFVEVFKRIDSISNYEPPQILPNGDIILRRSADAPAWTPSDSEPDSGPDRVPDSRPAPAPEAEPPAEPGPEPDSSPGFDLTPPPEADSGPDLDLDGRPIGPEIEL
jgi:hypothetical protein